MESLAGEDSPEDIPGKKKSKLKILKSRLFKRAKKADDGSYNLSQSTSDITAGAGLGSEEDLTCSDVKLGSRSVSHDSIFVADEVLVDPEPARVLSQENIHSKIKALQEKLQQQKLHLGPTAMGLSIKRPDHLGRPPASESASQEALNKGILQPSAHPLSPTSFVAPAPSHSATPDALLSTSPNAAAGLASDFSRPAQVASCLDTSAARHRMSVKPRNQRASTKGRKLTTYTSRLSDPPNNMHHPAFEEEITEEESSMSFHSIPIPQSEPEGVLIPQSEPEGVHISFTPQGLHLNSLAAETIKQAASQPETTTPQRLGAKPHQPIDLKNWRQPASSCVMTEGDKIDLSLADIEIQAASHVKSSDSTGLISKHLDREHSSQEVSVSSLLSSSYGSVGCFRSPSVNQRGQAQRRAEGTQRQDQDSESFHFSSVKGQGEERLRSSSFMGPGDHAVTRHKAGSDTLLKPIISNVNQSQGHGFQRYRQEGEHLGDAQQQKGTFVVGIAKDGDVKDKGAFVPRRETIKKGEAAQPAKQAAITTGVVAGVEVSQMGTEESVDAEEDQGEQGTAAFGVKLRSTSLSLRYRTEGSASSVKRHSTEMATSAPLLLPNHPSSATPSIFSAQKGDKRNMCEETDKPLSGPQREGTSPWSPRHAGGAATQPGFSSLQVTPDHAPESLDISLNTKEVEMSVDPQPAQTASQSASKTEVSLMSMAMEKTRSLQQLWTSRMPRDQGQNTAALPAQTQAVAQQHDMPHIQGTSQPLTEAMKPLVIKAVSLAQTAKPSQVSTTVQHNIPLNASKTPHMQNTPPISNQAHNMPLQPKVDQQNIQSSTQAVSSMFATPSALRPSTQMENTAQSAPGSASYSFAQANISSGQQPAIQQQLSRGGRGLQNINQFKIMTSAPPTASNTAAPSPAQAPALASQGGGGGTAEEGASQSGRRTVWQAGERAAFLVNRADGASTHGLKVDQSKSQTLPVESLYRKLLNKEAASERRQGQLAESSPTKVPGPLADYEEKRSCRPQRMQTSSSQSSSAAPSSTLESSASDRSRPSWLEVAKRKSMAWSDKTMD